MKCPRSNDCLGYPHKCMECQGYEDEYDYGDKVKFKIFWGNHTNVSADAKLNQWLAENPHVELVEWQYQQVRLGDHSICITYKEKEK